MYSERKGHPALIGRHRDFVMSDNAAKRWLEHMDAALSEMCSDDVLDSDSKLRLMNFLKHTAYFLVAGTLILIRVYLKF